jgi:urease accessory protein
VSGARLQRGDGGAELTVVGGPEGTALKLLYQHDPCRVLFPRPELDDPFTAVLITTSGGLAGGDRISLAIGAERDAVAVVTTQAAEKVYRSSGEDTRLDLKLDVGDGAYLEWVPQETILFDGARFARRIAIDVADGGRLLAAETIVLGRIARGERFGQGLLHDAWTVRRNGRLAWADALRLDADIPAVLAHPAGFDGAVAQATVLAVGRGADALLQPARVMLGDAAVRSGVTCIGGMLVARFLGSDAQALRRDVARLVATLRAAWMGLPARVPRLWHV